jgi:hypothetical protein
MLDLHIAAADILDDFRAAGYRARRAAPDAALAGWAAFIDDGSLIVTSTVDDTGVRWLAATLAFPDRDASTRDMLTLRDAVFGPDRETYQVWPAAAAAAPWGARMVRLWARMDGRPAVPAALPRPA